MEGDSELSNQPSLTPNSLTGVGFLFKGGD